MAAALYPFLNTLASCKTTGGKQNRIFIFIQLIGGNDGLNTLIPIDKYESIKKARPNLFIPENKILPLKGTSITGLHPSLKGIQDLYNNNLIGFVQGVGYENQNYSHFRSSDIWLTGSEATKVLYTGWMARFLDSSFHNYPEGFPSPTHTDPPAVNIGDTGTFLFQGKTMDMSIVVDPAADGLEVHGISEATNDDNTYAGKEVKSIREILVQTEQYAGVIKKAISTPFLHSKLYPEKGKNLLADQLKLAAKLINGGLQTSVYHVDLKGFDTHSAQVRSAARRVGKERR